MDDGREMLSVGYGPWGETISEQCVAAASAEAAGATAVYTSELHRTATIPAAAIALATNRVTVGTAIALAFPRSPLTMALTALDIDELSGGRFVLGLGAGVLRLIEQWHNRPYGKPAPHMREYICAVRAVINGADRGDPIDQDGEYEPLHLRGWERPFPLVRPTVPIYVAAMGSGMLRLAGEVADGWLAHELCSPRFVRDTAVPLLVEGLNRGGRSRSDLRLVASAICTVHHNRAEAYNRARGVVGFYATVKSYEQFFEFHGFIEEARAVRTAFSAGDHDAAVRAVSDEMVDMLTIVGTPDDVRQRLAEYEGIVDEIKLSPPTHFVDAEVTRDSQRAILELIGSGLGAR